MSYAPCRNRNCKSFGRPHPNCKCYGEMAEGGMVGYCTTDRAHTRGCEFFAEGGDVEVAPDDLPAADAVPSEDMPEAAEAVVPEDDLPSDVVSEEPADVEMPEEEVPADDLPAPAPDTKDWSQGEGKIPDEARAALGKDYEEAFGIGSLITGGGAVGVAGKAAAAAADWAGLGKLGSGFLKGALSNGLITASDEASKVMLGEDQADPVSAILASMGLGGVLGFAGAGASSVATNKLKKLTEGNFGNRATSWLAGLGVGANSANKEMGALAKDASKIEGFSKKDYEAGLKAFGKLIGKLGAPAGVGAAAAYGYHEDGLEGAAKYGAGAAAAKKGIDILGNLGGKVATPIVLKILSSGTTLGMLDALSHADKVSRGIDAVDKAVNGLFGGAAKAGAVGIANHKKLEDWLEQGGMSNDILEEIQNSQAPEEAQGFAGGGDVQPKPRQENGVAIHFPEQNVIMQAAKARAANYLNTLRPSKDAPRLAFDSAPDDRQQKKAYKRALAVAAQPLRVLDEIKRGTIEPDDIKHLNTMFPEVVGLLQRKLTDRISKTQLSDKRPSYKVRQGLSMLLGTPLSGELTPQSIQAAQAVFARTSQAQSTQPQKAPSGDRSKLSKSDRAYLTDDQARMARQQKT